MRRIYYCNLVDGVDGNCSYPPRRQPLATETFAVTFAYRGPGTHDTPATIASCRRRVPDFPCVDGFPPSACIGKNVAVNNHVGAMM